MGEVVDMHVATGTRIGLWRPGSKGGPFIELGLYMGPALEDPLIGKKFVQKLLDGMLEFEVSVLFRPDLGRKKCLETILIINHYVEEMWEYDDHWKRTSQKPTLLASPRASVRR